MSEKIDQSVSAKLIEDHSRPNLKRSSGLLTGDDPDLHRLIRDRIRQKSASKGVVLRPDEVDDVLPHALTSYLVEETELQGLKFLTDNEKLNKSVFEKILRNIAHLDFRNFSSSQRREFSTYDPDVITPQVSWATEQIFQNLPGFFKLFADFTESDPVFESAKTDIIRNVFILGYLHGCLDANSKDLDTAKLFLVDEIRKSNKTFEKLKSYPVLLTRLVETEASIQASPRLEELKRHWQQQFARRWFILARTGEASDEALSQATRKRAAATTLKDKRPAESVGLARKMDRFASMRLALQGRSQPPGHGTQGGENERDQNLAELELNREVVKLHETSTTHLRDILRLYHGNSREVFHSGSHVTEKWTVYKGVAETVLQKLVLGFTALNEAGDDAAKFDLALGSIIESMIQTLVPPEKNARSVMTGLFGSEFFSLAKIEQLCLMAFTGLSFLRRETSVTKMAIQILDTLVVPRLDKHSDIDLVKPLQAATTQSLSFTAFDEPTHLARSNQAKHVLGSLQPEDELVSIDSPVFLELLQTKKQLLDKVSAVYSTFARYTGENWWGRPKLKTAVIGVLSVMVAFASGFLNYKLSEGLLSETLNTIKLDDPGMYELTIALIALTFSSGCMWLGDKTREDFKKLALSSSKFSQEIKKFSKGGLRTAGIVLMLATYNIGSMFPQIQHVAQEWQQRWEESHRQEETSADDNQLATNPSLFWEDRNPEAVSPKDLLEVEKVDWGQVFLSENDRGQTSNTPLGFIKTHVVSPVIYESGEQGFDTGGKDKIYDQPQTSNLIINAKHYSINGDQMTFTLATGEKFTQKAAGVDFAIFNGIDNGRGKFVGFLDAGRVIDKIIVVNPDSENNQIFRNKDLSFDSFDGFSSSDSGNTANDYLVKILKNGYSYFVIYKTEPSVSNVMNADWINYVDNKIFWETHAKDREITQHVLATENPLAAALYAQMMAEQQLFWANFTSTADDQKNYQKLLEHQIHEYENFVKTNHKYSLRYKPTTGYAAQYPGVGVMLDVMALKKGGYYCQTAHLAAQEWFLSLGVPLDGLYGYSIFEDEGMARSRIGHVKTGLYGMVYDFTPSTPNPGEDLSALDYDLNSSRGKQVETEAGDKTTLALELIQKLATAENLALLVLLLSTAGVGYSAKLGIENALENSKRGKTRRFERVKQIVPDNEFGRKSLAAALLQLFSLLAEVNKQLPASEGASPERTQKLTQIVTESLILAIKLPSHQAGAAANWPINPEVLSLMKLVEPKTGQASVEDQGRAEKLWQNLSANKSQTVDLLEEVVKLLDKIPVDFEKTFEIKRQALSQEVRKIQKQLYRARKKEHRMYGVYGTLLGKARFFTQEEISSRRNAITTEYLDLSSQVEDRSKELERLTLQLKLIPLNVKNLKKVLNYVLNDIKNQTDTNE